MELALFVLRGCQYVFFRDLTTYIKTYLREVGSRGLVAKLRHADHLRVLRDREARDVPGSKNLELLERRQFSAQSTGGKN